MPIGLALIANACPKRYSKLGVWSVFNLPERNLYISNVIRHRDGHHRLVLDWRFAVKVTTFSSRL